jgi:hypothetical protein
MDTPPYVQTPESGDPTPPPKDPTLTECQDGLDNDGDGFIDIMDVGCEDESDTSEVDTDPKTPFVVTLEGVYDNKNGTYTAYFSYANRLGKPLSVRIGNAADEKNFFSPGPARRGQPAVFEVGEHRGSFHFTFDGKPLVWTLQRQGGEMLKLTVSRDSPKLPYVKPMNDCISANKDNRFTAVMGYLNPNPFPIHIPVGAINYFSPGPVDRAQPNEFLEGLNTGAFSLRFDGPLAWHLPAKVAAITPESPVCSCTITDSRRTVQRILKIAEELGVIAFQGVDRLERASVQRLAHADLATRRKLRDGIERAKRKAAEVMLEVKDFTGVIPQISQMCPNAPAHCIIIDDQQTLDKLRSRYYWSLNMIKRVNARENFLDTGATVRNEKHIRRAHQLVREGVEALNRIPRFRQSCR